MARREEVAAADASLQNIPTLACGTNRATALQNDAGGLTATSPLGGVDPSLSAPLDSKDGDARDGQTRRLLERVGMLHNALSCPLLPEDIDSPGEGEKPILGQGVAANGDFLSISDILLQSAIVGGPQRLGASLKGSLDVPCKEAPSIEDEGSVMRLLEGSSISASTRKRKPTSTARGEDGREARRRGTKEAFRQQYVLSPAACSMLLESLPKVTGVFFDRSQERWVSSVYMGGRNIKSYFPVYKHGFLQARNMAISQRLSQVAHKGISQPEFDALTPPGLTVEALLEVLKARGAANGATPLVPYNKFPRTKAEMQQETDSQHSKGDPSVIDPAARPLQRAKLAAKIATESPRASICSKSTTSPASCTSASPRVGVASAEGGSSASVSPPPAMGPGADVPMAVNGESLGSSSLLSSLHMYAALDFCPWERGVAWGAETLAWAVQQPRDARKGGGVTHVPVRLAERHKETLEALGNCVARVEGSSGRAKLALELRRIGRHRACQSHQEMRREKHHGGRCESLLVKGESAQEIAEDASEKWQHAEKGRSLASLLSVSRGEDGSKEGQEQQQWDVMEAKTEREQREWRAEFLLLTGETHAASDVEAAAGAVFQAVGRAYAEAIALLRQSTEGASDEEAFSALDCRAGAENAPQVSRGLADGGGSDGDTPLGRFSLSTSKEELAATPLLDATLAINSKSSGIAKRALMTRAAVALKPWPQGVSWASSSGRWFAVARLPSGSRVARTFHPSTKGGVEEAYRLACDFLKRIKDDPASVQADLLASNKHAPSFSRRPLAVRAQQDKNLFDTLQDLQQSKTCTAMYSRSKPMQNLTQWWQRQVRPANCMPHADMMLPVDLEGLAAMEACCRMEVGTPEAVSAGSSPSSSGGPLLESDSLGSSTGSRELVAPPAEQPKQPQQHGGGKEGVTRGERELLNGLHLFKSRKDSTSRIAGSEHHLLAPNVPEEESQAGDEMAQILSLQQEAVRRCLRDLRELSGSLFAPHVRDQKAAAVDAHLALVSKSRTFQHVVLYLHLFESALFGGQLPSRMPVETQRVFFGALDALAGALKLQNS